MERPGAEILHGIKSYLREHFPNSDIAELYEGTTRNVILRGIGEPQYRLEVTERFLDGEEGAAQPLSQVREWNVAGHLRQAGTRLVTLTTAGVHVEP